MLLVWLVLFGEINFQAEPLPPEINGNLSNVVQIIQDRDGFLWFAAQSGLHRYDGYRLRTFRHDPDDPSSISGNWVTSVVEDRDGALWIAVFNKPLSRLTPDRGGFEHIPLEIPGRGEVFAREVYVDDDGVLWVGLQAGGLAKKTEDGFTYYPADQDDPTALPLGLALHVGKDYLGQLWVSSSSGGLNVMNDDGTFERITLKRPSDEDRPVLVWNWTQDDLGRYWLATSRGLFRFFPEERRAQFIFDIPEKVANDGRFDISDLFYLNGKLFCATNENGLVIFDPEDQSWEGFTLDDGLPSNDLNAIAQDRGGNLWICGLTGGISRYNPNAFPFYNLRHNPGQADVTIADSFTKVLFQDSRERFWIGGNKGLDVFDSDLQLIKRYTAERGDQGLSSNAVRAVVETPEGKIWIGTWGGGLSELDPVDHTFTHFPEVLGRDDQLNSGFVESLALSAQGRMLWIGHSLGLQSFDLEKRTFSTIPLDLGPEDDQLTRVRVISMLDDTLLMLGANHGAVLLNTKTFERESFRVGQENAAGMTNELVRSVLRTQDGRIWLGTADGLHLFHMEERRFQVYSTQQGLANPVVYTLLEDGRGRLWMGTNNGISRFDPDTETFSNYFVEDGIQGNEFNGGAALRCSKNKLFFGGTNGITWFEADGVSNRGNPPLTTISELRVGGKEVAYRALLDDNNILRLPTHENFLEFDLAVLDYRDPNRNSFSYRMIGVDGDWSKPTRRNYINYPNLQPGDYTFLLRGADSEGVWSAQTARLKIRIKTPIYRTLWFQILAALIFLAPLVAWWHNLNRGRKILKAKVSERTHELEDTNRRLEASHEELKQIQARLVEAAHHAGMAEIVNGILHNLGNVLNSVNVTAESLQGSDECKRAEALKRLNDLLAEPDDLGDFFANDPKAELVPKYLAKIQKGLETDHKRFREQMTRLLAGVRMMRDTIMMQQDYAKNAGIYEQIQLKDVVEDMLIMQTMELTKRRIQLTRAYVEAPSIKVHRHKLANVLTNLLKNALDALKMNEPDDRRIWVGIQPTPNGMEIYVRDNGLGISQENLDKVFRYGFTTKDTGKGFGLHSCAVAMSEMGGSLTAESKGLGKGATFRCILPLHSDS